MSYKDFFEETSDACLKNAKQYIKDGEILYSFRSYGHALAMAILGNVEIGKTAIYNLYAKNLIPKKVLPQPYATHFEKKEIEKFAEESWWIGLVLSSNIEEIIQNLIEISEEAKINPSKEFGIELTQKGHQQIKKLLNKMINKNKKFYELEEFNNKAFFVKPNQKEKKVYSPIFVKKSIAKEQITKAKKNIKTAETFLVFPLNEVHQKIAQMFLKSAFQSILPIKKEVTQFIIPTIEVTI